MTTTLERTRLKIMGVGVALLALVAALLLAGQPAEAQVTTTGALESGKTNLCVLQQATQGLGDCIFTVPGSDTISVAHTSGKSTILDGTPVISLGARTVRFSASSVAAINNDRIGWGSWTVTNTPNIGAAVNYLVGVTTYA